MRLWTQRPNEPFLIVLAILSNINVMRPLPVAALKSQYYNETISKHVP